MNIILQNPLLVWHEVAAAALRIFPDEYAAAFGSTLMPERFATVTEFGGDYAAQVRNLVAFLTNEWMYRNRLNSAILTSDGAVAENDTDFKNQFSITEADLIAADAFPQVSRFVRIYDPALIQQCVNLLNLCRVTGADIATSYIGKNETGGGATFAEAKADAIQKFEDGEEFGLSNLDNIASVDYYNNAWDYGMSHSAAHIRYDGTGSGTLTAWGRFENPEDFDVLDSSFVSGSDAGKYYRLFSGVPIASGATYVFDPVPQQKEIASASGDYQVGYSIDVCAVIDRGTV